MFTLGFIQNFGFWEILIAVVVILLLFGSRLPTLGKSLGRSIFEFKSGLKEGQEADKNKNNKTD